VTDQIPAAKRVRAAQTFGSSAGAPYRMTIGALDRAGVRGGTAVDLGCGVGNLFRLAGDRFDRYIGVDVVRYPEVPDSLELVLHDLDQPRIPLPDSCADVAMAVEVIPCLENPWALGRELARLVRPGGLVVVGIPNSLSVLSMLMLLRRGQFSEVQDGAYPSTRTALVETDLRRVVTEAGLTDVEVHYSGEGRVPGTGAQFPARMGQWWPRALSHNLLLTCRRPA
jgi:SAM-dependent methyltransferase